MQVDNILKLGILKAGPVAPELYVKYGDYASSFEHLLGPGNYEIESWDIFESCFPESVDQCDAWLISGSRYGVYEKHPWIPTLMDFIRSCYSAKMPLVGVCFGHQAMAQALGGEVEKYSGGWCVGRTGYTFNGKQIHLNAWHQDQVVSLPPGATVLGSNDFCKYAFLSYGPQTFSLQPHPEFPNDYINGLIELRGKGVVPDELLSKAQQGLDLKINSELIANHMKQVLIPMPLNNDS